MAVHALSGEISASEIKKIGIIRANALGDFIITLPAIHALRAAYPSAEIVLLGRPWHKDFLEETEQGKRRTPVDRVIVLPIIKGLREEPGQMENPETVDAFFACMQAEQFDLLISFQGKGITAVPFMKKAGARYTVGLTCETSEKPDAFFDFYYYQPEAARYLEIVKLAGASPVTLDPVLDIFSTDIQTAEAFLKASSVSDKYIALHCCGTDKRRMWQEDKLAHLCQTLYDMNFALILTGSNADIAYNEGIMQRAAVPMVNAAGKLSLGAVAALYRKAAAVVSIDTGPLHLAIAAGAKTVGLYWIPNLINWGPLTRKNHRPAISWNMLCPLCGIAPNDPYPFEPSDACRHDVSFISDITVEEVVKNIQALENNSQLLH